MATTTLTVDNELLSATSIEAAKEARDLRHVATPFLAEQARVHGEGQPSKGSGHKWIGSFQTGDHSSPTKRQTGYEQMNLSFSGVLTPMVLSPAEVSYPIGISAVEEDLNGGDLQTIEIASRRAKAVMSKAKREFEEHILTGGVSQYDDWYSLEGSQSANADGFLEATAYGSQNNIIGGFNKGTHAALSGANNQFFDVGSSFNSNGLTGIYRTLIKARARATDDLSGLTVFMSEKAMENYKRTIQANERYMVMDDRDGVDGANMNLMISGMPAHVSTFLGSYTVDAKRHSIVMLDLNAIYVCWSKVIRDGYFSMSDFENVGNGYNVRVAEILVRGQLWAEAFGSSAIIADAETF